MDGDGELDADEVMEVSYVCAEVRATTLVAVLLEPVGANRAHGGQVIHAGPDSDGDGVLDASEIASANPDTGSVCCNDMGLCP